MNVLGPHAKRQQTPRYALQEWPLHELHEQRGLRPLVFAGECRLDQFVLHDDLQTLSDTRRKFTAPLNLLKCLDRYRSAQEPFGENIRGSDRILHCQIDSDAAHRRHGMRRVTDAKETWPIP